MTAGWQLWRGDSSDSRASGDSGAGAASGGSADSCGSGDSGDNGDRGDSGDSDGSGDRGATDEKEQMETWFSNPCMKGHSRLLDPTEREVSSSL
jgi:hypothetical protein